ncbi:DUF6782 family putative metallopeptidase [Thioclava pacifica]|uniref:DUF6782 domain-containing protein n=1 Tax=Thioclava pacifica DSM 10166 TaxID=1353537 RepID=A0A074J5E3_9RHOB|nr:DUF6782 family putative metallopeptidase [Thioclava pacifica]KEO50853.1 hypothetical protein TP2_13275 [Thioclava pacifica DSM 10166]
MSRPRPLLLAAALACFASAADAQKLTCAIQPFTEPPEIATLVAQLRPALDRWPSLHVALYRDARALCLADTLHDVRGYFEPEGCRIVIAADMPPALQNAVMIHELRHLEQKFCGACPVPSLSMKANARAIFAMEADAVTYSLAVAWDLREADLPETWDALAHWPMQADIAAAFEAEMGRSNDLSSAAAAAFEQWYAMPERRDLYYTAACNDYLEARDREHRLPTYGSLAPDFFERLCRLPDGAAYDCAEPAG